MKQIEVQIMGQSYLLGCPEGGEAQMRNAVERVDAAMCKIRDAGKIRARDRIAVLAALNLAFDAASAKAAEPTPAPAPAVEQAPAIAVPTAPPAADVSAALDAYGQEQLRELVERLDTALGQDGQLI